MTSCSASSGAHLSPHLELDDFYPVGYHRRLGPLVKGRIEHRNGIRMELLGKARPLERERHLVEGITEDGQEGVRGSRQSLGSNSHLV